MIDIHITIIGAGVVGLAIAKEVAEKYEHVVVVERHDSFGRETSSRNSEVIHDGANYPENSLKGKLCVRGNRMLYDICEKNNINFKKLGKLTLAATDADVQKLEALQKKGEENGVENLVFFEPAQLKKIEPYAKAKLALYSPNTGIVDTHGLMKHFAHAAQSKGALIVYNSEVIAIRKQNRGFIFKVKNQDGSVDEFHSKLVINAAGLYADKIAEMVGINIEKSDYRLHYCKGDYMSWNKRCLNHLIYPLPGRFSKGIHACLDLSGNIKFGPNAYFVDNINYDVTSKKEEFYNSISIYLTHIGLKDLSPAMSGIRPKLQSPDGRFRDFVIRHESQKNLTGFINLIGIESPGLTSSPAIAQFVARMTDPIMEQI